MFAAYTNGVDSMHDRVETVLSKLSSETFTTVARGALGDPAAVVAGPPEFDEITNSHNDQRTIGIVRVSGRATDAGGNQKAWSSVVKIVNSTASSGDAARWSFPENEQKVYELGLFTDEGLPLRPARCYLTQAVEEHFTLLWLEDLSQAPQPPWPLEHFISAANHLGQFNGYHSVNNSELPIEIGRDAFHLRWADQPRRENYARVIENSDSGPVRRAYRDTPVGSGMELAVLYERALKTAKSMQHGLAFGDSHSRNMFPVGSETVGIDWASLSIDPVGVDIGVLIGSALTFGMEEARQIAENERAVFDSYVSGLQSAGWAGELDNVRLGFFAQFAGYLVLVGAFPARFEQLTERRDFIEKRFGAPLEDMPDHVAPVIALIPGYVEELTQLLA